MPQRHPRIHRLAARLRGVQPHPRHWAALGVAGIAAIGLIGFRSLDLPEPRPTEPPGGLRIEVFTPVDPKIEPGPRMDVGELVDSFRYSPPSRPIMESSPHEPWDEGAPPPPGYDDGRRAPRAVRDRGDHRWLGLDDAWRELRAEAARRRARAEARDRLWDEREHEWRSLRHDDEPRREPPPDERWN